MALLTAAQLKARETPEFLVDLGDGAQVLVRRPDLQTLIFNKFMPLELVGEVMSLISQWIGKDMNDLTAEALAHSDDMSSFVDRWLCASMISPRCVMTAAEKTDGVIAIEDLTLDTKAHIFKSTFEHDAQQRTAEVAAASTFPEVGPGEGSGPDGEEVQPAPVVAA